MILVLVIYFCFEIVEIFVNIFVMGKKVVNIIYNIFGKVMFFVVGVVGGKEMVQYGFKEVKKVVGKFGLMGNVFNQFGEFDIVEEFKDFWIYELKDFECIYFICIFQGIVQ